jgi:CRP-like cAMP-binding protein
MVSPELLRRYPFFADLTNDQLVSLAMIAQAITYDAGETVFSQDEPARHFFLVVDGRVSLFVEFGSRASRATITDIEKSEVFGWSALVEPYEYTATAECVRSSELISFDGPELRQLIKADAQLDRLMMHRVNEVLASRLHSAYVELASVVLAPVSPA